MLFGPLGMVLDMKFISLPFLGDFFCIDVYCMSTPSLHVESADSMINVRLSFGSLFDVFMSMRRIG